MSGPSAGQSLADWVREKSQAAGVGGNQVSSGLSAPALRSMIHDLVFSVTDADTVAWAAGTIVLSDGTSYAIDAGNTGNMAARTFVYLDRAVSATVLQVTTTLATAVGDQRVLIATAINGTDEPEFVVYGGIGGLNVNGSVIVPNTIGSSSLNLADRGWSQTCAFSVTDADTVAWGAGSLLTSDGTTYSIGGGNTGNMAARTYIYLDIAVSTTAYQTTTTAATAVGAGKVLVATAVNGTIEPEFQVFGGSGGNNINANNIVANSITANEILASTITSSKFNLLDDAGFGRNYVRDGSYESWSSGTTSAPDGWTLTGAGATIARDTTNFQYDLAGVSVTAALNTATDLAQTISVSSTVNADLRGRTFTFSCRVKAATASRVFLKVDDGVGTTSSSNHTGGGDWETLSVTRTLNAAATKCEVSLEISSGASITASFDGAVLVRGSAVVAYTSLSADRTLVPRAVEDPDTTTTQSTTDTDLSDMSLANVILDGKQSVLLICSVKVENTLANNAIAVNFYRDTTLLKNAFVTPCTTANVNATGCGTWIDRKPAAGTYTYKLRWNQNANGGNTATAANRILVLTVFDDL